jgi:Polysaccharide deacetylase
LPKFNELRRGLESLPATSIDVFFRDDDADCDLPQLRELLSIFEAHQAALNLAVIPATLTAECARLLAGRPLFELHQHGWAHVNHELTGRKCEFGPSRPYTEQFTDIAKGQQRLTEMLGRQWARIFTPPWNRCTEDTCIALKQLGFEAISRDRTATPFPRAELAEISISIDLFHWKGGCCLKDETLLTKEIMDTAKQARPVGILLHHKVMDRTALACLDGLLNAIGAVRACRFHSLTSALAISAQLGAGVPV